MADLVYPPVIALARGMFTALGLKFTITGQENVPASGPAVMVINHTGYLDFTFAGLTTLPRRRLVRFMAKHEVFAHPVAGPLMRGMHHIPVDRESGARSYLSAVTALRTGEIIGVFPEATISRSFELKGFKSGAARMAAESAAPLLPVVIWGSQRVWTKGRPRDFRRPRTPIFIDVGAPVPVAPDEDPAAVTERVRARMATTLHRLQEDYPQRPAPGEDPWWLPARLGGSAPTLEQAERLDAEERAERAARRRAQRERRPGK